MGTGDYFVIGLFFSLASYIFLAGWSPQVANLMILVCATVSGMLAIDALLPGWPIKINNHYRYVDIFIVIFLGSFAIYTPTHLDLRFQEIAVITHFVGLVAGTLKRLFGWVEFPVETV